MVIGVYGRDEGYLVYLLLRNIATDYSSDVCFRFEDRLIFKSQKGRKVFFIPQPTDDEREILKLILESSEGLIFTKYCTGLKNCIQIDGDYLLETLKRASREFLAIPQMDGFLKGYTFRFEDENLINLLREKLKFYIPLVVAKRHSILFAWKYYLSQEGVPAVGFLYPSEVRLLEPILSNIGFSDKLFPLILGNTDNKLLEVIKNYGFVPTEVLIPSKNNIESELNFIYLAKEVAKNIEKA
ncbi:MAG: hypothetical protein DSZ31_05240 [Gammaproteobacteria bacterium]|nr:MAG: hypothetical protein DSZ31_05240 [Gammaproteobacteria bacterium]